MMPNLAQKDRWFNDIDKAWDFLESRGYICGYCGSWQLPNRTHCMTDKEADALGYLLFDWGFRVSGLFGQQLETICAMRQYMRGPWENNNA